MRRGDADPLGCLVALSVIAALWIAVVAIGYLLWIGIEGLT